MPLSNLTLLLDLKGLKRRWVAKQIGYTYQYISAIENGKAVPGPEFKKKMALLLQVPEGMIFPDSPLLSVSDGWVASMEGMPELIQL